MDESARIAWAAGLFEGEGSIQILGDSVRLYVAMTDEDTIKRLREVLGVGGVCLRYCGRPKPLYTWHLNKRADVESVLNLFLPWLGVRRSLRARQALEVIAQFHRTCYCGTPFLARRPNRIYCSDSCSARARRLVRA
jgi:hypothetical protein